MTDDHDTTLARYEQQLAEAAAAEYVLTLFVSGASEKSAVAISNAHSLCERHLAGRYRLRVVDVHRELAAMLAADVLAAPTLLREAPLPRRKLVGDLSDTPRVLAALNIREQGGPIAS